MKHQGSEIFGTSRINTEEYLLMAQIKKADGLTTEQIALEIEALDDVLSAMRMQSIITAKQFTRTGRLRKNSTITTIIDNRFNILCQDLKQLNP